MAGVGRGGRRGRGGEGRKKEGRKERKIFLLPKDFEITNRLSPTLLSLSGSPPEAVMEARIHLFCGEITGHAGREARKGRTKQ